MSQYNDSGYKAFPVSGAIAQYQRVILSAGQLAIAGLTDNDIGVMRDDAFAAGEVHTVATRKKPGTIIMVAAGAITKGVTVYTAASGQVSATQGSGALARGTALEAATAAGDHIEVLPF